MPSKYMDLLILSGPHLFILSCFFFFNTIYLFNQCLHSLLTVWQLVCRETNKTKYKGGKGSQISIDLGPRVCSCRHIVHLREHLRKIIITYNQ